MNILEWIGVLALGLVVIPLLGSALVVLVWVTLVKGSMIVLSGGRFRRTDQKLTNEHTGQFRRFE